MRIKIFITNLLAVSFLAYCVPVTTSTTPSITLIPTSVVPTPTVTTPPPYVQDRVMVEPYQDVRSLNLSNINNGSLGASLIETLWFDYSTIWSQKDRPVAQKILSMGMNPGMGVRELHAEGVTGKGVVVAIIDQPMVLSHPEFQGKVIEYYDLGANQPVQVGSSMHGPAVASLLVGKNIGTAPDAKVYFLAVPSWLHDAQYYADALNWVINQNKKLPENSKIRVVSVSAAPSGIWTEYQKNNAAWDDAYQQATDAGILVLDSTYEHGITVPCTYDLYYPDNVAKCDPNWAGPKDSPNDRINIPTSRTTAIEMEFEKAVFSYQYTGNGGLSWSIPYLTGILALGWQVNPELSNTQILEMLFSSAFITDNGEKVVNPRAFVEMVKTTVGN